MMPPFSLHGPYEKPLSVMEAALLYIAEGWAVVPILSKKYEYISIGDKRGRRPFHHRLTHPLINEPAVRSFFRKHPKAHIGIKTGAASGIFVLDIDRGNVDVSTLLGMQLPVTRTVLTSHGGRHLYFRYPAGGAAPATSPLPNIGDILGDDDTYALAPPSLHVMGHQYMWEDFSAPVALAPEALLSLVQQLSPHTFSETFVANPRRYTKGLLNTYIRYVFALLGK